MWQTVRTLCQTIFASDPRRSVRQRRSMPSAVIAAEVRLMLSSHALATVADGTVADRDLDGQSDVALTSDTSITNRWFNLSGIGQERGVFEFDLSQFAPGSTVLSAKIGLYVTSFSSGATSGPQLVFRVSPGDGAVTLADGDVAGVAAGTGTVSTLGYQEFNLSAATLQSLAGGKASVRMQNSALDGHWVQVASSEGGTLYSAPTLILEIGSPTLNLSITPNVISEDGTLSATGTLSRTGDISQALTVSLSTSDPSETSLPSTVTFAAGASSVEFSITAVDDTEIDGPIAVVISATAQMSDGLPFGADSSFGTGGIATTRLSTNIQVPHAAMAVQADGKILGASEADSGSWRITRYNADGSTDNSFGTAGMTTTILPGGSQSFPVPYRIVVQPNGKILVGGKYSSGFGSSVLARYNANGTIDTSFGNSGIADLANAGGWIEDIAVRPDGRILLAIAFSGTSRFRVAQLTSTGQFDSSFGIKTYTSINELARSVELLADGKFILAGGNVVARFTASGALDTTYGVNGIRQVELPAPQNVEIFDAKLDAAGRLSLGIYIWQSVGGTSNNTVNMAAARLTANGSFDTTFGNGGIQMVDFHGLDDQPTSMVLQSDGKILLGGYAETADNVREVAMVRFNSDGTLDTSFDGDGRYQQDVIPSNSELILGLAQQTDGKLLALGGWANNYRLLRFHSGPTLQTFQAAAGMVVNDDDVNRSPVINPQSFQVNEHAAVGTVVGQVVASDPNAGQSLTYEIVWGNDAGAFAINAVTGQITVANSAALDFETRPSVSLGVLVTDNGVPPLWNGAVITINLVDVNDVPQISPQSFTVDENSLPSFVVGRVMAQDADAGQTLTYAITNTTHPGAFAIDAQTGDLTLIDGSTLNYEQASSAIVTVTVTDSDNPARSSSADMTVNIADVNESPVILTESLSVNENAAIGTSVGTVVAVDPDAGQTLTYYIIHDTSDGAFAINASTGELTVADNSLLDFETGFTPMITIGVVDSASPALFAIRQFTININDVNDAPILFAHPFSVDENAHEFTSVGTVNALDVDAGQTLTFSITSSTHPGAFAIDPDYGAIYVADGSLLNYEAAQSATLIITATDNGNPALATSIPVTIAINDKNDAPTIADQSFSVVENSANGSVVGTVIASDADAGQSLAYFIVSSSLPDAFAINAQTGQVTVADATLLNYEAVQSVTLNVVVVDNGSSFLVAFAQVTIAITNANDVPLIANQTFSIREYLNQGETVGDVLASDEDPGQTLTYSITSSTVPDAFMILPSTGRILVSNAFLLDHETVPSVTLTVRATDSGNPARFAEATVTVNINDVNESPMMDAQTFSVTENVANGTVVGTVIASDVDAGQALTYEIFSSPVPGAFSINAATGQIIVANGALLNFESRTSIELGVQAADNGTPILGTFAPITINLVDVNEAPTIANQSFSVIENSASGSVVGTVIASDVDAGQSLTYFISNSSLPGAFAINAQTGQITVANAALLNYEAVQSVTLEVSVGDNGAPTLGSAAQITIAITNANEVPVIANRTFSVREYLNEGETVGDVLASDEDVEQTLTYSITSSTLPNAFMIVPSTGRILVSNALLLDHETVPSVTLTVRATDSGNPARFAEATVTVNINDVNESPMMAAQTFSIAENAANGAVVGTVIASDVDAGQALTYEIISSPVPGAFSINAATGQITVANGALLNFESRTSIELGLRATDNGTPVLSTVAPITINLIDVNEAPVVPNRTFTLAENTAAGTAVGTVSATDPDAGQSLTFAITGGNTNNAFAINAATGVVTVNNAAAINFEASPQFSLTVTATDNGSPARSGSATVTVNLTNVNDAPVVTPVTFSLAENTANGTTVGTVAATDQDAGQTRTFAITGGNTNNAFAINANTGALTVNNSAALNFEATPAFNLTVTATDNGTPARSGSATVTVNLLNVNEAPVVTPATFSRAENTANGTTVGTITATDPDAGQSRTFAITGGNTNNAFTINATTGVLTVNNSAALNFETTPQFSLTITATDNGSPAKTGSATVTVNLQNINEAPVVPNQSLAVKTKSKAGAVVGTVVSSDPDAGQTRTYSIVSGNGSASKPVFAINATTGVITVNTASSIVQAGQFTLGIRVTDNGSPALSTIGTVTVYVNSTGTVPAGSSPAGKAKSASAASMSPPVVASTPLVVDTSKSAKTPPVATATDTVQMYQALISDTKRKSTFQFITDWLTRRP